MVSAIVNVIICKMNSQQLPEGHASCEILVSSIV